MRNTTTPANGLVISGVWDSAPIAAIYIDSVSPKTIDITKIQSIRSWLSGATNAGYFTNDQINNFTNTIPAASVLSAAKNGRFTINDTSYILGGQPAKTVYCAVRLNGLNSLSSQPSFNSFRRRKQSGLNPLKLNATRSPIDHRVR